MPNRSRLPSASSVWWMWRDRRDIWWSSRCPGIRARTWPSSRSSRFHLQGMGRVLILLLRFGSATKKNIPIDCVTHLLPIFWAHLEELGRIKRKKSSGWVVLFANRLQSSSDCQMISNHSNVNRYLSIIILYLFSYCLSVSARRHWLVSGSGW